MLQATTILANTSIGDSETSLSAYGVIGEVVNESPKRIYVTFPFSEESRWQSRIRY